MEAVEADEAEEAEVEVVAGTGPPASQAPAIITSSFVSWHAPDLGSKAASAEGALEVLAVCSSSSPTRGIGSVASSSTTCLTASVSAAWSSGVAVLR